MTIAIIVVGLMVCAGLWDIASRLGEIRDALLKTRTPDRED